MCFLRGGKNASAASFVTRSESLGYADDFFPREITRDHLRLEPRGVRFRGGHVILRGLALQFDCLVEIPEGHLTGFTLARDAGLLVDRGPPPVVLFDETDLLIFCSVAASAINIRLSDCSPELSVAWTTA